MKVSYSQIEAQCNELHAVAQNMKSILDNIDGIRSRVSGGESWTGSASDTFSEKLSSVSKNFEEVFQELENSILYMASCAEGYQAVDEMIMKEICSNLKITSPNLSTSNIFNGG